MKKNRLIARIVGNAIYTFALVFGSVQLITEGKFDILAIEAGLITATVQSMIVVGQELKSYSDGTPLDKSNTTKIIHKIPTLF